MSTAEKDIQTLASAVLVLTDGSTVLCKRKARESVRDILIRASARARGDLLEDEIQRRLPTASNSGLYEPRVGWDTHRGDTTLEFHPVEWEKVMKDGANLRIPAGAIYRRVLLHRRALAPNESPDFGRAIVEAVWNEKTRKWRMFNSWGTVVDVDWTFWHWWMPAPKGPV